MAALMAATAIVLIALACGSLGGSWWAIAAIVILFASLSRFYFPSRFVIDGDGITARYLFGIERWRWNEVRRVTCDARGVYLSRHRRPSRLDAYRGLHLLFGTRRDDVLRELRARAACFGENP